MAKEGYEIDPNTLGSLAALRATINARIEDVKEFDGARVAYPAEGVVFEKEDDTYTVHLDFTEPEKGHNTVRQFLAFTNDLNVTSAVIEVVGLADSIRGYTAEIKQHALGGFVSGMLVQVETELSA